MIYHTLLRFAEEQPKKFYWRVIVPVQTLLLTSFCAPMYGFNALIQPINESFSSQNGHAWQGAFAGGLMLLGGGFGTLMNSWLLKVAKTPMRLLISLNVLVALVFGLGALAGKIGNQWLFLAGFALPAGLIFSNLYALCVYQTMDWARQFNKAGLQSGLIGLAFGAWGAFYSFVAPVTGKSIGFSWLLISTGTIVMLIGLISAVFFITVPKPEPSNEKQGPQKAVVNLKLSQLFKLAPYWLYFVFFMLFLIPGFGFKIIVQELSTSVFHATATVSAIMAVAYLATYGLSRLVFGILSDRYSTRTLYLFFITVQSISLLVAAITLPSMNSIALFTVLMCLVAGSFAAGKCIWMVLLLKLYGPNNFQTAVHATLPAYGLAGLLGPITLNYALSGGNSLASTSLWLYIMSGALVFSMLLFLMLKKVNYDRIAKAEGQLLSIDFKAKPHVTDF